MFEEPGGERVIAGRYRLLSPLGEGGMGTVWRARDEVLRREVAVKEVRAPAGLPAGDVQRMYTRLEREAWAAARVAHPNVVTVYDVATDDGRPWIVMELVRGLSLADLLAAEGPLAPRRAAGIGAEVLAALRAAHEAGVLHRDVKPGNVLLANDGRVVLTDFGIAVVEGSSALTMTGEVVGSPEFLAPERALGRTPGPESDLWSLGVLLYAAVEGSSPFRQDTPLSTLRAIVDEELPPPRRAGPLAPVIEGLLRKDPAERLPADRAERDLRLVGAGGAPGTETVPVVPSYSPTVAEPATFGSPSAAPPAGTASGDGDTSPAAAAPRNRRAAVALITGIAVLVLALAGLTYALLNRDDDGRGGGDSASAGTGGATPTSPPETSESGGAEPAPGTETGDGGNGDGDDGDGTQTSSAPAQSVEAGVTGSRTEYAGACPPSEAEAPAFTATFRVARLPAEVVYRWVTPDGALSGQGWKTLSFPAGGGREKQDTVVVTTYDESGTVESEIGVEVREPVRVSSDSVPFSVTCEGETPTDGTSPSASDSPYSR
ncbi:serine/threonine-protein kinase [Streptomyces sp. NPDC023723]|uniref:serine/threonine-protein kinase n=1 Tax=Streptomyces sp. NPDC023723 TaxID=3154323 RepID=UPI0033EC80C7